MTPRRGEIWWAVLDPTKEAEIQKTRPCLIVSTDIVNERRLTVVVIPLSTSPTPRPPLLVQIQCMGHPAVAVVDQIRALAKERLLKRAGSASTSEMAALEDSIRQILELN